MTEMKQLDESSPLPVSDWDQRLAWPMFGVGLAHLLMLGAYLHLTWGDPTSQLAIALLVGMGITHLLVAVETWVHWSDGGRQMRQHIGFLLLPMLRICPHDHVQGDWAWIPWMGWKQANDKLERRLTRLFGIPMIVVALLVLPVVGLEFLYLAKIDEMPGWFYFALETCSGFIWMAFVFEFVVMISVVEKKLTYCRTNWIDLLIILLPLMNFIGAARLSRLLRLKQLGRTAKVYRMRGLLIRSWRAIVALEVIDRLMRRTPEKREERLLDLIAEKQEELDELQSQLAVVRAEMQTPDESDAKAQSSDPPNADIEPER